MKTLTKYGLILLATLSVSGCFSEDDKSYTDVVETSQDASQEELQKPRYLVKCWMWDSASPTHTYKVSTYRGTMDGVYNLPDGTRVPTSKCIVSVI